MILWKGEEELRVTVDNPRCSLYTTVVLEVEPKNPTDATPSVAKRD
jgi:hypothetical protein